MREGQGLLTEADLAGYRVREREPLAFAYRGHRLLSNPEPSLGGPLMARTLALLEERDVARHRWGSAEHLGALAAVMEEVERLRVSPAAGGTTHVSISDAAGNAASLSLSNGEGSGYIVPGTGIMLNNMLGEDDLHPEGFHASLAGERVASMMSPTLVLRGGSGLPGGGQRRKQADSQRHGPGDHRRGGLRHGRARGGRGAARALGRRQLQVEPGFDGAALAALRRVWRVNAWSERNLYFGGVHAVNPAGEGAGDPRREGHGGVVDAPVARAANAGLGDDAQLRGPPSRRPRARGRGARGCGSPCRRCGSSRDRRARRA